MSKKNINMYNNKKINSITRVMRWNSINVKYAYSVHSLWQLSWDEVKVESIQLYFSAVQENNSVI